MARWKLSASAVTIVPFSRSISSSFVIGGNFVRLRVGGDLRQHKAMLAAPGGDHVQRRLATGAVERAAQNLAVDRHNPFALLGETSHEPLKRRPELLRIEHAEKPAERVMAGNAILKPEKPAQERLLRLRKRPMSTEPCPPHRTAHMAIAKIS